MERTYLNVPFEEKDEAKALGAWWDPEEKSWYTTSPDLAPFSRWYTETFSVDELSDEQQNFITTALTGRNVLVDACIGSGKTTTIQTLCNCPELSDRKILYLTYNKLLKVDAKEKITGNHVYVTNYHGFASRYLWKAGVQSSSVGELIQSFIRMKPKIDHFDLMLLDEYQDIDEEISHMLLYIKSCNPSMQIIAVGDMEQKIYDKTRLDVSRFIREFLGSYEQISFTKCFRLSEDYAARLGRIWHKDIHGVNDQCMISYMFLDEVEDFLSEQEPEDILCLGANKGSMPRVLNSLEEHYPDKFNKKTVYASIRTGDSDGSVEPNHTTAIFTTFDASKGMERDICCIFDFDETYWSVRSRQAGTRYEILRNIFAVAMSRGKKRIVFVRKGDNDDTLEDKTLMTPFREEGISKPFDISTMFDFKFKEDIEKCYELLTVRKIHRDDKSNIGIATSDGLIDLSPCVGNYQEVVFFNKCDVMDKIKYANEMATYIPNVHRDETTRSLEDDILYLTSIETSQSRYFNQVTRPFVTDDQKEILCDRLRTVFDHNDEAQVGCMLNVDFENGEEYSFSGICDVIKGGRIYELKYVSELSHVHFLQLACYLVAFDLPDGILWNTRNNDMYEVHVANKSAFLRAVVATVSKGKCSKMVDYSSSVGIDSVDSLIKLVRRKANVHTLDNLSRM